MTRLRLGALLALAVAFGAFSLSPEAMAAAEVHRLNLVISAMPSQIDGGGMNDLLERYNQYPLKSRGAFEPLDKLEHGAGCSTASCAISCAPTSPWPRA